MQKILLATDGSSSSRRAVQFAIKTAKTHPNVVVSILHVCPPVIEGTFPGTGLGGGTPLVSSKNPKEFRRKAEKLVEEIADTFKFEGIKTEQLVYEGNAGHTIAETANAKDVDQIIMGTRGLSELKGLLLGSVSHQVLHLAKCPVTLVK